MSKNGAHAWERPHANCPPHPCWIQGHGWSFFQWYAQIPKSTLPCLPNHYLAGNLVTRPLPCILPAATITQIPFVPLHLPPTSNSHLCSMVNVTLPEREIPWLETLPLTVFTATVVFVYALPLGSWYAWPALYRRNILDRRWLFFWLLSLGLKSSIPIASALMTFPKAPDPSTSPRMSLSSGNSKSGS